MTWAIYRLDERSYKIVELSINDNTKSPQKEPCVSFWACQKTAVEFNDSTHTIYWPAKVA